MKKILYMIVALLLALAPINFAYANHNGADVMVSPSLCSATMISASVLDPEGTHIVDNMYLIVEDSEGLHAELIPVDGTDATIVVGPYDTDTMVHWRVFGGGERDYDQPLWNGYGEADFSTQIADYIDTNGDEWIMAGMDDPNPFTTWESMLVEGCDDIDEDGVINDLDCDASDSDNSLPADSKACQLYMSGVGGLGIKSAPGLMKPFNPVSMALENAGKKK